MVNELIALTGSAQTLVIKPEDWEALRSGYLGCEGVSSDFENVFFLEDRKKMKYMPAYTRMSVCMMVLEME